MFSWDDYLPSWLEQEPPRRLVDAPIPSAQEEEGTVVSIEFYADPPALSPFEPDLEPID